MTAAALRCLNGQILGRLVVSKPEHEERLAGMGVKDPKRIYDTHELAPGKNIIFACCGVTEGNLLRGVRFFGGGIRTHSLILTPLPASGALHRHRAPEQEPGCESGFLLTPSLVQNYAQQETIRGHNA